jgi:hypothetical protein
MVPSEGRMRAPQGRVDRWNAIREPHQLALQVDQPPLLGGGADHAPEVPLGVHPAQRVGEHVEPAGVVGDDHGVGQQPARDDRADHGGLGRQPPAPGAEAERLQVRAPGRPVGEAVALVGGPPPEEWRDGIRTSRGRAHVDPFHAGPGLGRGAVAQG